jgi:hypothetical protein
VLSFPPHDVATPMGLLFRSAKNVRKLSRSAPPGRSMPHLLRSARFLFRSTPFAAGPAHYRCEGLLSQPIRLSTPIMRRLRPRTKFDFIALDQKSRRMQMCVQMTPTCAMTVLDGVAMNSWMYQLISSIRCCAVHAQLLLDYPHCAGEANMDIVSRGGSAASGVDREIPTTCSVVHARAEETTGEARGAPFPPRGRPCFRLCDASAAHAFTVTWFVGLCPRRYWSLHRRRKRKRASYHPK